MPSVLITRPLEAAAALAAALQKQGYEPVIEPLLTITPTAAPRPDAGAKAVMITSGNALTALEARAAEIDDLFDLPCFCVGPRTAEKAHAFGFRHVESSAGDGTELAQLIVRAMPVDAAPLLHIAGADTDSKAADALREAGRRVVPWPVYAARPVERFTPAMRRRLEGRELDAVLVFSPRTAMALVALLRGNSLEACCEGLAAICLIGVVAGELKALPWRHLVAADEPTEDAVIACLQNTCPVSP